MSSLLPDQPQSVASFVTSVHTLLLGLTLGMVALHAASWPLLRHWARRDPSHRFAWLNPVLVVRVEAFYWALVTLVLLPKLEVWLRFVVLLFASVHLVAWIFSERSRRLSYDPRWFSAVRRRFIVAFDFVELLFLLVLAWHFLGGVGRGVT